MELEQFARYLDKKTTRLLEKLLHPKPEQRFQFFSDDDGETNAMAKVLKDHFFDKNTMQENIVEKVDSINSNMLLGFRELRSSVLELNSVIDAQKRELERMKAFLMKAFCEVPKKRVPPLFVILRKKLKLPGIPNKDNEDINSDVKKACSLLEDFDKENERGDAD